MRNGRPVEQKIIERITELHGEGLGRNEIARRLNLGAATITRYAREAGLSFDTTKTELAVAVQNLNLETARRDLVNAMVIRAQQALEAFDAPATIVHFDGATEHTNGEWVEHVLDAPTFSDQQRIMTMAGIAFDKATRLSEKSGVGAERAIGLLDTMSDVLDQAAEALRNETPTPPVDDA